MMDLLLWIAVGVVGGLFVGVYLCLDPKERPPWCGTTWFIVICGLVGALVGALIYYVAARVFPV